MSDAYAITLTGGGDRWPSGLARTNKSGEPIAEADFDLAPSCCSHCHVTVIELVGRRAWSNSMWP
ncbi:MAG: hypothetical protein M3305_02740 [Actinomycetota bacterium]|nr:hypothetical protein [Actinomycetota bacterium]